MSRAEFADSGERLDARTVRDWGRRYSNWRRFGAGDELGTLNFVTRARVLAAASLVRSGLVVSCALPFGAQGDDEPDPPHSARWEPLARVERDGRVYNDRDPADVPAAGASAGAIDRFADGVVGRGVLLDLARFFSKPWLDDGARILPADLDACAESSGVTIDTGDILLVRTGRLARCFAEGSWRGYADGPAPGLSLRCIRWLHERQIAALASDTARVEVQPAETTDCVLPLHQIAARDMGLWLGNTFHLDRLAEACAADGRHAFLFSAAPIPKAHPFDGPINPLAIK